MIYRIEVTQEDIDLARQILSTTPSGHAKRSCCPLARAIRRHTSYTRAEVGTKSIALSPGEDDRVTIPEDAYMFRRRFDRCEPDGVRCVPFSFDLEVPDEGNR